VPTGSDGVGANATFFYPTGITADPTGTFLYVTEPRAIRRINIKNATVLTISGKPHGRGTSHDGSQWAGDPGATPDVFGAIQPVATCGALYFVEDSGATGIALTGGHPFQWNKGLRDKIRRVTNPATGDTSTNENGFNYDSLYPTDDRAYPSQAFVECGVAANVANVGAITECGSSTTNGERTCAGKAGGFIQANYFDVVRSSIQLNLVQCRGSLTKITGNWPGSEANPMTSATIIKQDTVEPKPAKRENPILDLMTIAAHVSSFGGDAFIAVSGYGFSPTIQNDAGNIIAGTYSNEPGIFDSIIDSNNSSSNSSTWVNGTFFQINAMTLAQNATVVYVVDHPRTIRRVDVQTGKITTVATPDMFTPLSNCAEVAEDADKCSYNTASLKLHDYGFSGIASHDYYELNMTSLWVTDRTYQTIYQIDVEFAENSTRLTADDDLEHKCFVTDLAGNPISAIEGSGRSCGATNSCSAACDYGLNTCSMFSSSSGCNSECEEWLKGPYEPVKNYPTCTNSDDTSLCTFFKMHLCRGLCPIG
jgi:hypothetical protein